MRILIVKVLYFASAQEMARVKSEVIRLGENTLLGDLASEIRRLHPSMKPMERTFRYAVNCVLADEREPLHEGDEVGVLPPVAGG